MELIRNIIVIALMMSGIFFFIVGTVGLIRMPDVFSRMHATTKCDTLGAGLILLAVVAYNGINVVSLKFLMVLIFIWITNPTSAHIIAKSEYKRKIENAETK
ncbi:MAG: monovalent cation/H(+) antiporter subunit G [Alkaliphilus sp.]